MALSRGFTDEIKMLVAEAIIGAAKDELLSSVLSKIAKHFDTPVRLSASATPDALLNISANEVEAGDGAAKISPPIEDASGTFVATTINFQTGSVAGGTIKIDGAAFSLPTGTVGRFRRLCLTLLGDGTLAAKFSAEQATFGNLETAASLFSQMDGLAIGYIDLECDNVTGKYRTAGSATAIIENKAGVNRRIFRYGAGSGTGGGGDSSFKLTAVSGSTVRLKKGKWNINNKYLLISGNVTTDVPANVDIDLASILASPAATTLYWLCIDLNTMTEAALTDNGQVVMKVYQASQFVLLARDLHDINTDRFIPVGTCLTVGANWTNVVVKTIPPRFNSPLGAMINAIQTYVGTISSAAASNVLPHGLGIEPQIVLAFFNDASTGKKSALDLSSMLVTKGATNIEINTAMLTFDTSDMVEIQAFAVPKAANGFLSSNTQFKSDWFTGTGTTTVAHGLVDMDEIASYEVQEWDVTNNKRRNISRDALVVNFNATNFYLNWAGITPSATMKYRVVTGGTALPTAVPFAKRNQYLFTDIASLTPTTTAYPLDIVNDEVGPLQIMQMVASNKWQSVPVPDTVFAEKVGSQWYLRGDLSLIGGVSSGNPVKISVQTTAPMLTAYPSILKYSLLGQAAGNVGSAGQIRQFHQRSAKSFRTAESVARSWWNLLANLNDGSGNARTLTSSGSFGGTSGPFGDAALIVTNQTATAQGAFFAPAVGVARSVGALLRAADWTPASIMGLLAVYGSDKSWELYCAVNGDLVLSATTTANGGATYNLSATLPNPGFVDGSIHALDVVYDGAKMVLFVDGKRSTCEIAITDLRVPAGTVTFFIGGSPLGVINLTGHIREPYFDNAVAYSDVDIAKLAATRIDHNANLPANRQDWRFNHYAAGVAPCSDLQGIVLDKADQNSLFVDLSGCDPTDKIDAKLFDF